MSSSTHRIVQSVFFSKFGGFDRIKITGHPLLPADCEDHDIEVQVKYCGVNFADLYMRQGLIPTLKLPHVLGLECVGNVVKTGSKVTSFVPGQRILCYNGDGGLYRKTVIINEKNCFPIPDSVNDETAVSLPANYLTAYFSLFDIGNLKPGDNVLIHSCTGGVGWAATQLARTIPNVTIVGTASSSLKSSEAEKNGVNYVISSTNYLQELNSHPELNTMKFNVIIETIGGSNIAISQSLLDHLGKVIVIGVSHIITDEKKFSIVKLLKLRWRTKNISVADLVMNNKAVAGLHMTNLMNAKLEKVQQTMNYIFDLCKSGAINPRIDSIHSLSQIVVAMKKLANRENIGKVIVMI